MDGKRLRGSRHEESDGVHLLGLFGHKCQSSCGQTELKEDENEISAALRLLQSVNLEGLIITGDAVFAQKNSAKPS